MGHGGGWGRGMVGVVAGLVAGVGSGRSSGRSSGRGIWYWPWWAWTVDMGWAGWRRGGHYLPLDLGTSKVKGREPGIVVPSVVPSVASGVA